MLRHAHRGGGALFVESVSYRQEEDAERRRGGGRAGGGGGGVQAGTYDAPRVLRRPGSYENAVDGVAGGRFNLANPKSDVEWRTGMVNTTQ